AESDARGAAATTAADRPGAAPGPAVDAAGALLQAHGVVAPAADQDAQHIARADREVGCDRATAAALGRLHAGVDHAAVAAGRAEGRDVHFGHARRDAEHVVGD